MTRICESIRAVGYYVAASRCLKRLHHSSYNLLVVKDYFPFLLMHKVSDMAVDITS